MAAGTGDADLLWRAQIDDQTQKFFDDFDKRVAQTDKAAAQGFASIGESTTTTGVQIGVLAGIFSALTTQVIQFGTQAVASFIEFLQTSTAVTDEIDSMSKAFSVVGQNLGYSQKSLDGYVESLSAMDGITRKLAIETLSKLAENEVDLTKITDIAKVSQDAAAASNMTVAQSFTMITNAIERQSPFMLKRLGLSVDMETAYRREAQSLGIQVDQLTKLQKQQALVNEILEAGKVVNGAYAASSEGLTQETERQAKIMEEIQLELGNILLPVQVENMKIYRALLEDIMNFLRAHHDDLVTTGEDIGHVLEALAEFGKGLIEILGQVISAASQVGDSIIKMGEAALSLSTNKETVKWFDDFIVRAKDADGEIKTFVELLVLAKGMIAGMSVAVEGGFERMAALAQLASAAIKGDVQGIIEARDNLAKLLLVDTSDKMKAMRDASLQSVKDSIEALPWLTKEYDANKDAADQAAKSAENYAEILQDKLNAAVEDATAKLEKLKEAQDLKSADLARQAQRQAIEQQLRDQWAEEDRVRQHEEGIQNILENAQEAKTDLAKRASDVRVQIEKDYTKRLKDIHDQFDFDSEELIRKRDAVGLLALIRQNKHQLDKEAEAQKDRRKEAQDNYDKTLKDLDESTQKQLKKYEEAYAKQLEGVQRNLDRQKQLKQLHDQWAQEDRDRELRKQLQDIVKSFMAMDGVTKDGLTQLLKDWGWYFGELGGIISEYYGAIASAFSFPTTVGNGVNHSPGSPGNYGAAGQVSQMLSPDYLNGMSPASLGNVSRLPSAPASKSNTSTKIIRFEGSVEGLDPYIQRVMVKSLLEIERNNNG